MPERWFILTILATICFALGSFMGKLGAIRDIPHRVYFFEAIGTLTVFTTFVLFYKDTIFNNFAVNYHALAMGIIWGTGTVLFILALKYAKLSVMVPLSAAYPAITVVLALVFLGERLGPREILGVSFAVVSTALLAKS